MTTPGKSPLPITPDQGRAVSHRFQRLRKSLCFPPYLSQIPSTLDLRRLISQNLDDLRIQVPAVLLRFPPAFITL